MYNPYMTMQSRMEVIRVNGRNGAESFRMPPNSSTLLLDETAPVVWLVQSDGAGYHTAVPYGITPIQQKAPEDAFAAFEERLSKLEAKFNESYPKQIEPAAE